ncbi:hypothetical protein ABT354_09955 [Streptomyces sp. NPDC000594]|uniref:hypothetical protein n=1 Tax=Streptomyces sp. NPDC000594 TaxID=3154261 RepID=UPI00331D28C0
MNTFRTATVSAVVTALGAASLAFATAAPVQAAPKPAFLAAKELPASLTAWTADPVAQGKADDFCYAKALPKKGSSHREFRTELDTSAVQTVTVAASATEAKKLVTKVRAAVEGCLEELRAEDPGLTGKEKYHGRIAVEEGAHVYSLDTATAHGATDIHLYSVGRDGRTVTVVHWGQLGDLADAPLKGFQKTARTSVAKLY